LDHVVTKNDSPFAGDCHFAPDYSFSRVFLQSPREHQAKDRNDHPNVQEEIGGCQKAAGENKLDQQIDHDQAKSDNR
jgi:hypothetical protein